MAFIKANYKDNERSDFDALPTGTYEMLIQTASEKATPSGAESLQIRLLVRNDLDGVANLAGTNAKYHNRIVFMDNWKRKATNQYDTKSFQYILDACQIPEGTSLDTVNDFIKAITGKAVKVYVKKTTNTYQGETTDVNRVAPWNFDKTDYPKVQHKFKDGDLGIDPFANDGEPIDIHDDDLPF